MKVEILKSGDIPVLQIQIPLQQPAPSKSGKTLVVATSAGIVKTNAQVDGKQLSVGLNAFIPR